MRWEKVQVQTQQAQVAPALVSSEISTSGPGKRWGHTCNALKGGRFLYVFGGYGKDNCQTNQVHVFDTVNQTWSQPVIKGMPPTPRDSHSCTTVGDNLYVFGGTDGMNPLKDLHILDTSSHTWISPSVRDQGPEAREGHSAALVGKRLFIFGGCGKSSDTNEEIYYNDLYILNTETLVWKCAETSGIPPSARDSHTCSSWKNKIIVIGGEDGHDYYLSDVHILDADTLTWKELNTSGQMLSPRAGHATVAFGKNLFVFGGFTDSQNLYDDVYMLDVDTGLWMKVMTTGEGPSARFSVAGDCLDPLKGGALVFIGGCNKSLEALDDMYYLYTGLASERKLEKLSLKKQLKLKCQEKNLISAPDRSLVRFETISDLQLPMSLSSYGQPRRENFSLNANLPPQGKTPFQAKLTESFPQGYTIETTIDGKPLRGILFANKPSFANATSHNGSRKRAAGETGGVMLNGDCNSNPKAFKTNRREATDQRQTDGVQRKEFTFLETAAASAVAAAPDIQSPEDSNAFQSPADSHAFQSPADSNAFQSPADSNAFPPVKDPVDPESLVTPLNLNDDRTNNALNVIAELSKESLCSLEKYSVALPTNQDDRTQSTEGDSNPTKSI